jgi:hypothetical protein
MHEPLPVIIVLCTNQSKGQRQQLITGVMTYGYQQCALEPASQECAINQNYRPAMLECPYA